MKKIKYLVLIILVLLFSGCSGNYNLTFNKDLSVTEELELYIENESDNYDRTYNLLEEAGVKEDEYEVIVSKDIKVTYKKDYSSFEEYYLDSKLYKILFDNLNFGRNNIGMTINANSNFKLDDNGNENITNSYYLDNFKINLKVPFVVNENNADIAKDNVYTWNLDNKDTYKEINIDFSYKKAGVGSIIILIIIGGVSIVFIIYIINTIIKNRRI